MHHKFVVFPFTAIVGQDAMKKALLLVAIDPTIGGVLIKGDKGTGKSTAVRALSHLLPEIKVVKGCPFGCDPENIRMMCRSCQEEFERNGRLEWIERKMEIVDMPLSATEDMVVGSLDIKRALKDGIKALEPGILARANRNILYIDEVNLLEDHLVNVLLDSAAMGINIVEREGVSVYHPSRFILIGTMNPEEGELRPQILDRFGLCVDVGSLQSKEDRLKVMEYRRMFDEDPWKFEEMFLSEQERLKAQIIKAKEILRDVRINSDLLEKIVDITIGLGIKTHRADIVVEKTVRALSALKGKLEADEEDLKEAVILALSHRMRQNIFEKSQTLNEELICRIMNNKEGDKDEVFDSEKDMDKKKDLFDLIKKGRISGNDFPDKTGDRGLYIKAKESRDPKSIAIDATIKKAIRETGSLEIRPEHLMEKMRIGRGEAIYIILLDSSSSMRLDKKIRFAKGLSHLLLKETYEKRSRIALIVFRGEEPVVLIQPTSDILRVEEALENLPTGGKTPLTPALYKAFELCRKEVGVFPVVILISDGKGNVFIKDSYEEDLNLLQKIYKNLTLIIVNTENKNRSIGILEDMACRLNAAHFYLEEIVL